MLSLILAAEMAQESLLSSWIPHSNLYQIALDTILLSFAVYILMRKPAKPEKPLTAQVFRYFK